MHTGTHCESPFSIIIIFQNAQRRCGNLLLRNRITIRNVISRNKAISTLEIATKTLLMFFPNKKPLHPGFSRNDDAAFVRHCGMCPSVHQCLHRPCFAETKTSGVTSLRIAFLNHPPFPECSKAMWQSPP
jgi:hypothetical protein